MHRIKIVHDEDASSPREWDNLGILACFHSRYNLGDEELDNSKPRKSRPVHPDQLSLYNALLEDVPNSALPQLVNALDSADRILLEEQLEEQLDFDPNTTTRNYISNLICNTHDDLAQTIIANYDGVVLPVYLYDHSGLAISTGPFSCPWDSGQVGFIYCSRARALKEGPTPKPDEPVSTYLSRIADFLRAEISIYNMHLHGYVYGFVVERLVGHLIDTDDPSTSSWEHEDSCFGFIADPDDPCSITNTGILDHIDDSLHDLAQDAYSDLGTWRYSEPVEADLLPDDTAPIPSGSD